MTSPRLEILLQNTVRLVNEGRFQGALGLAANARSLAAAELGEQHPDFAKSLSNLAAVYHRMADYEQAEPLYQQALEIERTTSGHRGATLSNFGLLCQQMGDYGRAETLLREAVSVHRATVGEEHAEYAASLNNLGLCRHAQGDYVEAAALFGKAIHLYRSSLGLGHPHLAQALNNLGGLLAHVGDHEGAERLYQQALEIRRSALGGSHPDVAETTHNLAVRYDDRGEYVRAETLHLEAIKTLRSTVGDYHPLLAGALNMLARNRAATGRLDDGLDLMEEAARIDDRMIGRIFSIASERQRMAHMMTLEAALHAFLSLIRAANSRLQHGRGLDLVLRRKAIVAEALAIQRESILRLRHPQLSEGLRELTMLQRQIATKALAGPGPEGPAEHRRLLDSWEGEREALEARLAHEIPELEFERRVRQADRAAVSMALPEGSVLLEFVRFDVFDFAAAPVRGERQWMPARYLAFVLAAGEPDDVRMVDVGEAAVIDELILLFRDAVTGDGDSRGMGGIPVEGASREREAGMALREVLIDPLLPELDGRTRLFLAPDGDLTRLPFEVLPTDNGGRLIQRYTISYVSTGRDVLRFGKGADETADPLVAAAPNFDLAGQGAEPSSSDRQSRDLDPSGIRFDPLDGTRQEGDEVGRILGASPWVGDRVLEAPLKAFRSPRVLHLATHGFFLPDQGGDGRDDNLLSRGGPMRGIGMENPLLRSGLALAGANTFLAQGSLPEEAEDGIITAEDVSGLDLVGTELVVLSACETGLGEVRVGEGVFGLRRAFVLAGARTLVMSLWKVPDGPSAELMLLFYENLGKGIGRAEALRQAQLTIAAVYPPPWFWGAFICQGDPGPLELAAP